MITITKTGSASAADLQQLRITRTEGGDLTAEVVGRVTGLGGQEESRSGTWTLSAAEKSAIQALLPSALAAFEAGVS